MWGDLEEEVDDEDNVCLVNGEWFFWGCACAPQRHKNCVECKCDGCRNKEMVGKRGRVKRGSTIEGECQHDVRMLVKITDRDSYKTDYLRRVKDEGGKLASKCSKCGKPIRG